MSLPRGRRRKTPANMAATRIRKMQRRQPARNPLGPRKIRSAVVWADPAGVISIGCFSESLDVISGPIGAFLITSAGNIRDVQRDQSAARLISRARKRRQPDRLECGATAGCGAGPAADKLQVCEHDRTAL